jgi:hypothetical protein
VPSLSFYAVGDDHRAVLTAAFDSGAFRVFEAYSEPDRPLREFDTVDVVPDLPSGRFLMLYAVGSGPEPVVRRIDLRPGALDDATYRYSCEGWGLIQLHLGGVFGGRELRWSRTAHNTEKRAAAWAAASPRLGDPALWDWASVTKLSGRLNRVIRRMAVTKLGARPVLPRAAEAIEQMGLRYEYGTGLHAAPAFGQRVVGPMP